MDFVVSWLNDQSQPQSIMKSGTFDVDEIAMTEDLPVSQGTTVWVYPVADIHQFAEFFSDQTRKGTVIDESPGRIKLYPVPNENDDPLITLVQRKIPQANEYIKNYNAQIARAVLDTVTHGELITSVGGITHSQKIVIEHRAETLVSKLNEDSITNRHLGYTSMAILAVDHGEQVHQIEVYLDEIDHDDNSWVEIIPMKLQYGKSTMLETHHYEHTVSPQAMVWNKLRKSITYWFRALRTPQYLITFLSILVALSIVSINNGSIDTLPVMLIVIGTFCVQTGGNMLNDYFDHISELDEITIVQNISPTSNRFIQNKLIHPVTALTMGVVLFSIGLVIGLYLNFTSTGNIVLYLGIIGAVTTYFYTGEPLKLAYRGIGEIILALNFGPLIIAGTYYVLTDALISIEQVTQFALPPLLFISGLLILNEIDDIEADRTVEKMTTAVRLGRENSLLAVFIFITIAINITIISMQVTIILIILLILSFITGTYALVKPFQQHDASPRLKIFTLSYFLWTLAIMLNLV